VKNHVWRPLFVVLGLVAVILLVRLFIVPDDFSVGERGYMYGYHRLGNEQEWKDFKTKFRTSTYCNDCHEEKMAERVGSPHALIECENCHGLAGDHPDNPEKLTLDRSRELCLRCHTRLAYPSSQRKDLAGIDPQEHNPGDACVDCHNPHRPNLEEM
jgi:predicted CXXCH cytochrome family protein